MEEPLNSQTTENQDKIVNLLNNLNNKKVMLLNQILSIDKDIKLSENYLEMLKLNDNQSSSEIENLFTKYNVN